MPRVYVTALVLNVPSAYDNYNGEGNRAVDSTQEDVSPRRKAVQNAPAHQQEDNFDA